MIIQGLKITVGTRAREDDFETPLGISNLDKCLYGVEDVMKHDADQRGHSRFSALVSRNH